MSAARLTTVETIYHQVGDKQASQDDLRFQRWLDGEEEPFRAFLRLGPEWQPLPCGWNAEGASYLRIRNDERLEGQVVPTEEEKALLASKLIEVGISGSAFAVIKAGEGLRFQPYDANCITLRCSSGPCRCSIILYPA